MRNLLNLQQVFWSGHAPFTSHPVPLPLMLHFPPASLHGVSSLFCWGKWRGSVTRAGLVNSLFPSSAQNVRDWHSLLVAPLPWAWRVEVCTFTPVPTSLTLFLLYTMPFMTFQSQEYMDIRDGKTKTNSSFEEAVANRLVCVLPELWSQDRSQAARSWVF